METSGVIDLGNFLEASAFVRKWANPLKTVERARRQRLIQFTTGDVLNRCAQFTQNLAAQTGHAEFQAIEVCGRVDFFAEPATGLRAGVSGEEHLHVEDFTDLVVQIMAATVQVPVCQLLGCGTERHGGEICQTGVLADKVIVGGVVHIRLTGGYGIKDFERADKLAGGFLFDGQRAVRHFVNHIVQIGGSVIEHGKTTGPSGDHGQCAFALGIKRCGQCGCSSGRPAKRGCLQK